MCSLSFFAQYRYKNHRPIYTIVGILTFMSRINFMLGWAESERSFITSGPSVHVSGTKMSYMLLLVLFSILSFGFLFFHVHHLCMPLLGPELVNKILVFIRWSISIGVPLYL